MRLNTEEWKWREAKLSYSNNMVKQHQAWQASLNIWRLFNSFNTVFVCFSYIEPFFQCLHTSYLKYLEKHAILQCLTEVWNMATTEFFCRFVLIPGYNKALRRIFPTCQQLTETENATVRKILDKITSDHVNENSLKRQ